jgi:CheY-like chemotaxis protein
VARQATIPQDAHILVVEDDSNNRLVAVKLLAYMGVPSAQIIELAGLPSHLSQQQLPERVDLVLLDLQLPGKDGYQILNELRQNPAVAGAAFVALTANVMKEDMERARTAGFDSFIGKPIDGRRFPDWIRRILAGEDVWVAT